MRDERRSPPTASGGGSQRLQPRRRTWDLRGAFEPLGGRWIVPEPPVVNEPDVVHVLPAAGAIDAALQQRDRLIGTPRSAGIGLGEEDRAEPVREIEARVERRDQIEQRVKEVVVRRRRGLQALAAVVHDRPHPVEVGEHGVVAERQALHGLARANHRALAGGSKAPAIAIAHHLQADGGGEQERKCGQQPSVGWPQVGLPEAGVARPSLEVLPPEHGNGRRPAGSRCTRPHTPSVSRTLRERARRCRARLRRGR